MKNILVIGAGLSSSYLINYLKKQANKFQWQITVADAVKENAQAKIGRDKNCRAIAFDINNKLDRETQISQADLVISLLPPSLHIKAANDCLKFKKHLVTASYISPAMRALDKKAKQSDIIFLNEIGLDPGIDHISAMQMMDQLRQKGAQITSFKSYCGGLVAKKYDDNPWHYKFTWNPKNVVTAGQAAAKYKKNNQICYVPASRIFEEVTSIEKEFEAYLNRDSISYIEPYHLENTPTVLRGTLRIKGFSAAWNILVQLGITDDSYQINQTNITFKEFTESFLPDDCVTLKDFVIKTTLGKNSTRIYNQLLYIGLLSDRLITQIDTPANILLSALQSKWKLQPGEHDRIVMIHYIDYVLKGKKITEKAYLEVEGETQQLTAMAKTVGLPMGIAAKLILTGKIKARGVLLPTTSEFYNPILSELKKYGVAFRSSLN